MRFQSKFLKCSENVLITSLMDFIRVNLPKLKTELLKPYGETEVERFLAEKSPNPELAKLVAPLAIQRAQNTLSEPSLKQGLMKLLLTPKATEIERKTKEQQVTHTP